MGSRSAIHSLRQKSIRSQKGTLRAGKTTAKVIKMSHKRPSLPIFHEETAETDMGRMSRKRPAHTEEPPLDEAIHQEVQYATLAPGLQDPNPRPVKQRRTTSPDDPVESSNPPHTPVDQTRFYKASPSTEGAREARSRKPFVEFDTQEYTSDPFVEIMCARSFFQIEHAEAKNRLLPISQEMAKNILDSRESLRRGLEILKTFSRRADLKALLEMIASTINTNPNERASKQPSKDIEKAITKLRTLSGAEWKAIQKKLSPLQESEEVTKAFHDYLISREENLWLLNAEQNIKKGDKEFLEWVSHVILAPTKETGQPNETGKKHADKMIRYLFFWYSRHKEMESPSKQDFDRFSEELTRQCTDNSDLLAKGGLLEGLIQPPNPESGQYFHTIAVRDRSYTFAESLDVWHLKTHAPDIRILQDLTAQYLGSSTISTKINESIRSEESPEKKALLQASMTRFVNNLKKALETNTSLLRKELKEIDEPLAKEVKNTCKAQLKKQSPISGTHIKSRLIPQDSSEEDST